MLLFDQVSSWILVALCYWIMHQTAPYRRKHPGPGLFLMRFGVALLGLSVAIVTTFRLFDVVFIAGGIWKMCLNIVFLGVIVFHKNKFGKL